MSIQHFRVHSSHAEHRVWCTECDAMLPVTSGDNAASRARRWARKHVKETGHEVRIDVTKQHGYRP